MTTTSISSPDQRDQTPAQDLPDLWRCQVRGSRMTDTLVRQRFVVQPDTDEVTEDAQGPIPICPTCDRRVRNQPFGMNCRCPF